MPEGPWLYPADQTADLPAAPARRRDHPREDLPARARGAALCRRRRDHRLHRSQARRRCASSRPSTSSARASAPIVLGKGGQTLKWIGEAARTELGEMLDRPVHLFLYRQGQGELVRGARVLHRHRAGFRCVGADGVRGRGLCAGGAAVRGDRRDRRAADPRPWTVRRPRRRRRLAADEASPAAGRAGDRPLPRPRLGTAGRGAARSRRARGPRRCSTSRWRWPGSPPPRPSPPAALPEREPHTGAFDAFEALAAALSDAEIWPAVYVRFEAGLLAGARLCARSLPLRRHRQHRRPDLRQPQVGTRGQQRRRRALRRAVVAPAALPALRARAACARAISAMVWS